MQERYSNLTGGEYTTIGTSLFGGITGFLGSQENKKAAQAQANALIAQGKSQVEVARIMQETERLKLAQQQQQLQSGGGAGSKTLIIALGVGGVIILGVIVFAVTRK
jgi:Flp pilus assembly protein TadB